MDLAKIIDLVKSLVTFNWAKNYRTLGIVGFVVAGYVAETFLGMDIPGVDFTLENVVVAVGLVTAAAHAPK